MHKRCTQQQLAKMMHRPIQTWKSLLRNRRWHSTSFILVVHTDQTIKDTYETKSYNLFITSPICIRITRNNYKFKTLRDVLKLAQFLYLKILQNSHILNSPPWGSLKWFKESCNVSHLIIHLYLFYVSMFIMILHIPPKTNNQLYGLGWQQTLLRRLMRWELFKFNKTRVNK